MKNILVIVFIALLSIKCNFKNENKITWEETFTYQDPPFYTFVDNAKTCKKKGPIYCKELAWNIANANSFENLEGEYTFQSNKSFNEPYYDLKIDSNGNLFYSNLEQTGKITRDSHGIINAKLLCEGDLNENKVNLTNLKVNKISCVMLGQSDAERGIIFKMQISLNGESGCYFERYIEDNTFCEFDYELRIK
ncbi:hypothetical protein [Leptospira levettii]|uniref:Lipoprotein n=1 Tax=Leptospira levettii TaxID=2023178 RepID=A0ABY2MPJ8_9LEPT|nr:hypothetical protein [Leptospira levettii]TGL71653.1 hypothetical protein EHQ60_08620 [Leptospira levettii]